MFFGCLINLTYSSRFFLWKKTLVSNDNNNTRHLAKKAGNFKWATNAPKMHFSNDLVAWPNKETFTYKYSRSNGWVQKKDVSFSKKRLLLFQMGTLITDGRICDTPSLLREDISVTLKMSVKMILSLSFSGSFIGCTYFSFLLRLC